MLAKKAHEEEFLDKFTEEIINNLRKDFLAIEKEKRDEERKKREKEVQEMKEKFSKEVVNMQPTKIKLPQQMIPKIIEQKPGPQIKAQEPIEFKKPIPIIKPVPKKPEKPKQIQQPKPVNIEAPKVLPQAIPGEIDFGKIIYLIKDPLITYIECPGPNKNIIIRKAGNSFMTQIKLTKDEMIAIVKSFSIKTRIPLVEGMLTARYENIEISAIISETVTSSFIIKKDIIPPVKRPPTQLQPPNQPYARPGMPRPTNMTLPGTAIPPTFPRRPMPMQTQSQGMPLRPQQPEQKESIWNKKIKIGK